MKKLLSVLLCAVMVLSLAACGKKDDAPIDDAGNGGDADGLTVALVVAGKLGDRSFYDSSKEGLDRMVADLGVTPIVIECNNENHDIQMKNAAEKANIVVCVGWEFYNVETIAPDYPEVAKAAILEMFRQTGSFVLDENDMLISGVLIRHLILPENEPNSREVIDFVSDNFPGDMVLFSLMSQFTPMPGTELFPELQKTVTPELNDRLIDYMCARGIEYGFWQEPDSATGEMIPAFDLTGV